MIDSLETENIACEAREFISELRGKQSKNTQTLRGRPGLPSQQRIAIRATSVSYVVAGTPPEIEQSHMIRLLERFEELARRHKMELDARLRPHILSLLVTEMWTNKHCLKMPPEKLIAATAYHGAIGVRLIQDFPRFAETPSIYKHAIMNYPAAPAKFLRKAQAMIDEISADVEFVELRETPGLFTQAVLRNPSNPRGFLISLKKAVAAMEQDDEFIAFRSTPGIFRHACLSNPSDPRAYIRNLKKTISEMREEEEFSGFRNTPGMFLQAAVRNPSNPRGFLRRIKTDVASMSEEKEFADFHDKPNILQYAAVHNPSDPRGFLRKSPESSWHALLVKSRKASGGAKGKRNTLSPSLPKKPKK